MPLSLTKIRVQDISPARPKKLGPESTPLSRSPTVGALELCGKVNMNIEVWCHLPDANPRQSSMIDGLNGLGEYTYAW